MFNITQSGLQEKKTEFIKGKYTLPLPHAGAKVVVKIMDMLSEEVLTVK